MEKRPSNTINQTFSIPLDISRDLHAFVKRREMSRFVSNAIKKELDAKKKALRQAYLMANKDAGQVEALEDWKNTLIDNCMGNFHNSKRHSQWRF